MKFEAEVTARLLDEARENLRVALVEHGAEWAEAVAQADQAHATTFADHIAGASAAYAEWMKVRALSRKLGSDVLGIGALNLPLKDLGLSGQLDKDAMRLVGQITTTDVLYRLQNLGTAPQPEDEHEPRFLEKPVEQSGLSEQERTEALAAHRRQFLNLDEGPDRERERTEEWERANGIVREHANTTQEG